MNFNEFGFFSIFLVFIIAVLMIDLGVFKSRDKGHVIGFKEAGIWTAVWVFFALCFYVLIYFHGELIHGISNNQELKEFAQQYGHNIRFHSQDFQVNLQKYDRNLSLEYITGYLIEYALSVDNIFVMILLFMAFGVNEKYYHRVLFWGILGAIIMRFLFIFVSAALIQRFSFMLYLFGGLLIFTGIRMFITRNKQEKVDPQKNPIVKFTAKYFAVYPRYVRHHFWVTKNHKTLITPLFVVLLVIEVSDIVFAVDSVPAIFSVTKDPYIVFFSNIFAILGLRSLFFLVMNIMHVFHYLKTGLSVLLTVIGIKMIFSDWLKDNGFTTAHSLYIILFILTVSILASIIFPKKKVEKVIS